MSSFDDVQLSAQLVGVAIADVETRYGQHVAGWERSDEAEFASTVELLADLRSLTATLQSVAKRVELDLADHMQTQNVTQIASRAGVATRRNGTSRKHWDVPRALGRIAAVTQAESVDHETGEVLIKDPYQATAVAISECVSVGYLRKGPAKNAEVGARGCAGRGIDINDFCETSYGNPSVQIVMPDEPRGEF